MTDHFVDANKIDERLAHLPDDLRKVAEEFLTLHQAWDTGFEVCSAFGHQDLIRLIWPSTESYDYENGTWGSFFYQDGTRPDTIESWSLHGQVGEREVLAKQKGDGFPLRRSADFAEFVRRFAKP